MSRPPFSTPRLFPPPASRALRWLAHRRFAWAVLATGLAVTGLACWETERILAERARERFEFQTKTSADLIKRRMLRCELLLQSAVAFLEVSPNVDGEAWRTYVDTLELERFWPGILSMAFAEWIPPGGEAEHVARVRAEGFPNYAVTPPADREERSAILFVEPFNDRNLRGFGFDMFSEPICRAAMERARDTGEASLSGKVNLVKDLTGDSPTGVLLYLPVHWHQRGMPERTVAELRAALRGFVCSPFRVDALIDNVLGQDREIDLQIFDGTQPVASQLLFDSRAANASRLHPPEGMVETAAVQVVGRDWLLRFSASPGYARHGLADGPLLVGLAGVSVTVLLFLIVRLLVKRENRANELARVMTSDLRKSEERIRLANLAAGIAVWEFDPAHGHTTWDPAMFTLYGVAPTEGEILPKDRWRNILHPDDRDTQEALMQHTIATGGRSQREFRIIRPSDGAVRVIQAAEMVLKGSDAQATRVVGINFDVTERKQAEAGLRESLERIKRTDARLERANSLLTAVSGLLARRLTEADSAVTFDTLHQQLLDFTASDFGFVAEVLYDPAGQPYLKTHAITNIAWNDESRALFEKHRKTGMEFRNLNTLFGHALKTGEPLISNSPATHPARGGLPPGHPPLHCFLGVPIKWANKLIGMVGVANRAGGYDQALVDELEPLFSAFGSIINDVRVSKERDAADERIMALNVDLRDRAERLDKANRELAGQAHLREQALENAVLRLRHLAAMDAASDGIALLDAEGLHTYTNKAHAGMFGFETAETLIGQSWKVLYDPPEWQRIEQKVFPELMERRHWHGRATARRCDGGSFLEDLTLTLTPEGTLIRVSRDVTAAAAVEQEIRTLNANLQTRAQELSRANRELSDFAHVVSHDLKAPLRGIGSLANWLQTDYAEQLGLEGTLQLRMLTGRVKRLAALIDGILSYSRAGRVDGSPPPVALDELVRSTIDLLAPPPDITITIETPLPRVTIDATRAQQLFQNLLSNAIKHRDKPGGRVAVRCAAEGGEWHFSVADNGPGIEAKYFERIFGLFQTLARRDDMEASGVGLAVVKKIVETERGRVWVESEYGRGATFHFTLPRCPQPPLEAPASPP